MSQGYNEYYQGNYYGNQNQRQISKQEIAQIQDHELSVDTMCRVLTLAEKYALGENLIYGAYNLCSSTGEDLLRLFVREIEIFRLSFEDYVENYGEYKFPSNKSKAVILEEINKWKNYVKPEDQKYYECLIKIIKGNCKFSLKEDIKVLKSKKKKKYIEGENAKNLMNHVPIISHNTRALAKKAEANYMNDDKYSAEIDFSNRCDQHTLNALCRNYHANGDYDDMNEYPYDCK